MRTRLSAFTLPELMAALAIIGALAIVIVPRIGDHLSAGDIAACHANKAEIEVQAQLWRRNTGSWPNATLSDIGSNLEYFPDGLPTCPVDNTTYTIDTTTGLVVGHEH
ncbi:MAG: prepilin-type N-terminal cleavage/methylation domain-containing protein [Planctomycetota bacterium]